MIYKENLKDSYFILVVLFSGMATSFFRSMEGLIVLFALGGIVFYKHSLVTSRKLIIALLVWTLFFIVSTITIKSFHPYFYGIYFAKIVIAFWLVTYYKNEIFEKYEKIIYKLVLISLFFYSIQVLSPSFLYNVFSFIDVSGELFPTIKYKSIGFYTFHQGTMSEIFPRNSGFTWEPGPFSCYIGLAMFFNIVRNGVSFKDRKTLIVFLIALITTQSTTGFLLLLTILTWYGWAHFNNKIFRVLSIPMLLSFSIVLFFSIPFLQEKIVLDSKQDVNEIIAHAQITGSSYAPGRFVGWKLRWEDFKSYPVAGIGGNPKLQFGYIAEGNVVGAINGLGTILGKYGAFGAFFFLLLLYRFGKYHAKYYDYTGIIIFPVLILIIGFSFGIIETPIIIAFLLLPVFIRNKNIYIIN